MEGEI